MPAYPRSLALLLVTSGLALPLAAQKEPDAPGAAQVSSPNQSAAPAPAPDHKAQASDSGGKTPEPSGKLDDFARADSDHDGRVSPKEYAASDVAAVAMVASGKRSGSEAPRGGFDLHNNEGNPQRSSFFRRLDADKDGFLSRDEFAAAGTLSAGSDRR